MKVEVTGRVGVRGEAKGKVNVGDGVKSRVSLKL